MRILSELTAPDGTKKFLFELDDGKKIESVLISHKRTVCACVSSQVGCAMGCAFCATGRLGFSRNLSFEEIAGQFDLMQATIESKITNVVFMGMGEPLMNYDNVVKAVNYFHDKGLSWQKITVSTVGLPDKIRQLGKDVKCKLAWSLHAPNDILRSKLIKVNCRYPIADVISACNDFPLSKKGPLMIEYVLLEGINDSLDCAKELGVLLKQIPFIVINLILFNPVEGIDFKRPSKEVAEVFKHELIKAGFKTIIRTTKGLESNAACGMLAGK